MKELFTILWSLLKLYMLFMAILFTTHEKNYEKATFYLLMAIYMELSSITKEK